MLAGTAALSVCFPAAGSGPAAFATTAVPSRALVLGRIGFTVSRGRGSWADGDC